MNWQSAAAIGSLSIPPQTRSARVSYAAPRASGRHPASVRAPKRTGSSARQARHRRGVVDRRGRRRVVQPARVDGDRGDARRPRGQRDRLVQADELVERRDRMAGAALDLGRARPVAEHVRVRRRAVDQPERDARVQGMDDRALALDPEQPPPRSAPSTTSCSAAPARKSDTTASTAIPHPAIAIPVWPVGTNTESSPRARAARSSSSDTVIFPIAQSEPTVRTVCASTSRFAPVGTLRPAGGRRRSRSSTPCSRASALSSGSSAMNSCSPFSTSRPPRIASASSARQAGGKRPPCVATPTSAVVGSNASPSATVPTTGMPLCVSPGRRVDDRDRRVEAVVDDAAHRLAVVRVAALALREDQVALHAARRGATPRPGVSGGTWTPSTSSTPGHGSSASSRLPSRSTWSQRLAIGQPAAMPRPGLDHAAEHHAEAERARRVRHADGLADAARLRELDRDPVRALAARGDVGQRVAVLVDEDRDGRAALQLGPLGGAGAQRLLAVLDAELGQLRQRVERLVERPPLVDVDLHRHLGDAANGADALHVEAVAAAELQLQPPERGPVRSALRAMSSGSSGIVQEVGGPVRRRPSSRHTGTPRACREVVQRRVERGPAAYSSARRQARLDLVEGERVVAEQPRRAPPRTPARRRPTRRSARSAQPRPSRSRRRARSRPGRPRQCPRSRARW